MVVQEDDESHSSLEGFCTHLFQAQQTVRMYINVQLTATLLGVATVSIIVLLYTCI